MKKLFALLLALCLLMTASLAPAEDVSAEESLKVRDLTNYPSITFGKDSHTALKAFVEHWSTSFSFSKEPSTEAITLEDGSKVYVMTLPAGPSEEGVPMTVKFYFVNEKLAAAVQEVSLPEGSDYAAFKASADYSMRVAVEPLDLQKVGKALTELIGEAAHLEAGQDAWVYTVADYVNDPDAASPMSAVLTARGDGDKVYMAEFLYGTPAAGKVGGQNLAELEGFDKLTSEEQNAVSLYAEFLQKQQKETLEEYIAFLLNKHQ